MATTRHDLANRYARKRALEITDRTRLDDAASRRWCDELRDAVMHGYELGFAAASSGVIPEHIAPDHADAAIARIAAANEAFAEMCRYDVQSRPFRERRPADWNGSPPLFIAMWRNIANAAVDAYLKTVAKRTKL